MSITKSIKFSSVKPASSDHPRLISLPPRDARGETTDRDVPPFIHFSVTPYNSTTPPNFPQMSIYRIEPTRPDRMRPALRSVICSNEKQEICCSAGPSPGALPMYPKIPKKNNSFQRIVAFLISAEETNALLCEGWETQSSALEKIQRGYLSKSASFRYYIKWDNSKSQKIRIARQAGEALRYRQSNT